MLKATAKVTHNQKQLYEALDFLRSSNLYALTAALPKHKVIRDRLKLKRLPTTLSSDSIFSEINRSYVDILLRYLREVFFNEGLPLQENVTSRIPSLVVLVEPSHCGILCLKDRSLRGNGQSMSLFTKSLESDVKGASENE